MDSSRLRGKILLKIENKPILYHVVKQTLASKYISDIIIATTTLKQDDKIINFCQENKLKFFRGSHHDLLDRYYQCSKKFKCDPIVRITSDCPLIDPKIIDKVITLFLKNHYDYVSNNLEKKNNTWQNSTCNFPQGMTVEISTFDSLKKAWKNAKKPSEREHVFPYIQFNPHLFKITSIKNKTDHSHIRCTIDRNEDLKFVREIIKRIPKNKKIIHQNDILKIIKKEPDLVKINNYISYDEGWQSSLVQDKLKD